MEDNVLKKIIGCKIFIVIAIIFLVIGSWNSLVFAESNSMNVENIDTEEDLRLFAPITISASISKVIPATTPLLSEGVISGGQPTYKISVLYKFTSPVSFNGGCCYIFGCKYSVGWNRGYRYS